MSQPAEGEISFSDSAGFILALDATGSGTPVPMGLEGLPSRDSEGQTIHYRRVLVAECGNWTHRATGDPLPISKDRADEWIANTKKLAAAGVQPFLTTKHPYDDEGNFATPDARDTLGNVVRMERDGEKVYAIIAVHGDDNLKVTAINSRSIGIAKNVRDARGGSISGEALHHLAVVPNPALPNLGGTMRIAASADVEKFARVYQLNTQTAAPRRRNGSHMTPELATKARAAFSLSADAVPDDQLDNKVAEKALALSADVSKLTAERDEAKAKLDSKAQEVLALSADRPRMGPEDIADYLEQANEWRLMAIDSGAISFAQAQVLTALLSQPNGEPSTTALTADGVGSERRRFGLKFWKTMAKLGDDGIRRANTLTRDPASHAAALALSAGSKTSDPDAANAGKSVAERYNKQAS